MNQLDDLFKEAKGLITTSKRNIESIQKDVDYLEKNAFEFSDNSFLASISTEIELQTGHKTVLLKNEGYALRLNKDEKLIYN